MKNYFLLLFFTVMYFFHLNGQTISGFLINQSTRQPIVGAEVFINGAGRDVTTSTGRFSVDIRNCKTCTPGSTVSINIQHIDYGYDLVDRVVKNDNSVATIFIDIVNSVQVTGRVRNRVTNNNVGGIKVTCQLNVANFTEPIVTTDNFGRFKFIFSRQLVGTITFINILCNDPAGCYADEMVQKPINQILDIDIPLDKQVGNNWCLPVNKQDIENRIANIIKCDASSGYGSRIGDVLVTDGGFTTNNIIEFSGTFQAVLIIKYGGSFKGEYDTTTRRVKSLTVHNQLQGDRQMTQQCINSQ